MIGGDDNLYVKIDNTLVVMFWSDNPATTPETTKNVLSIYMYRIPGEDEKKTGNIEDYELDSGEVDVTEDSETLSDFIELAFDFMKVEDRYNDHTIITEEEANELFV